MKSSSKYKLETLSTAASIATLMQRVKESAPDQTITLTAHDGTYWFWFQPFKYEKKVIDLLDTDRKPSSGQTEAQEGGKRLK